jgi:NADPH:quinone reductase-like Zn-dependent oxidoreductase
VLFGSRARGQGGPDSDIDLFIEVASGSDVRDAARKAYLAIGPLYAELKRGVDIVFEHVGSATWEKSIKALAVGGRLVTCGATTGYTGQTDIRYLYSRHLSILGSYMASKAELLKVVELVKQRRLKPVVDKVYPLAEAASAQERMEKREHFGKIVLRP